MIVKSFDTHEEMFDYLEKMQDEAARALEESEIKPEHIPVGQYFIRFWKAGSGDVIAIFGEAVRSPYAEDWPLEDDARKRGYIMSQCYSVMCPDGELGSTHVGTIHTLITREVFEIARANGWRHVKRTN